MRFLGFAGVLCALVALGETSRAQTPPPEAAKARETVKLLDEALKPLRLGDYDKDLRRAVLRILLELQPQVEALKPRSPAQAWRKLSADVNDAVGQEKEFWAALPKTSPRELPQGTAAPLIRKTSDIAADFRQLFPEARAQRPHRGAAPAERAKIAGIDAAAARRAGAAKALPGRFFDGALTAAAPPVAAAPRARPPARPRGNSGNLPLEPTYQLRVGAVPAPSAEEAACRKASDGGAFASDCGKNWISSRTAPLMSGLFDAFKEQFGTVSGIVTNLALMVGGLILGALSGVGLLIGVVKALCAVAILPVAYSMIRQLASAMAEMAATKKSDVRHWRALREVGKLGGALLIMVLLSFVGYKLGGNQAAKKAVGSMAEALQSKLGGRAAALKPKAPARDARKAPEKDEPATAAKRPAAKGAKPAASKHIKSRLTLEDEGIRPPQPAARTSAPSRRQTVARRGAASAVAVSATPPQPAPAAAPIVPAAPPAATAPKPIPGGGHAESKIAIGKTGSPKAAAAPAAPAPARVSTAEGIKPPEPPVKRASPAAAPTSSGGHDASRIALGEKVGPPPAAPAAPSPVSAPPERVKPPQPPINNAGPAAAPASSGGHAASKIAIGKKVRPSDIVAPTVPSVTAMEVVARMRSITPDIASKVSTTPNAFKAFAIQAYNGMRAKGTGSVYDSGSVAKISAAQEAFKARLSEAASRVIARKGLSPDEVITHGTSLEGLIGMLFTGEIRATNRYSGFSGEGLEVWGGKGLDVGASYGATKGLKMGQPGVEIIMSNPTLKVVSGETLNRAPQVRGDFVAAIVTDGQKTVVIDKPALESLAGSAQAWKALAVRNAQAGDMREFNAWQALEQKLVPP